MKRIKTLLNVNEIAFSVVILLAIMIVIPTELVLRLVSPAIVFQQGEGCVYDAFIITSEYSIWLYILPFLLLYILYIEKYQLNPAVVLRKKTIKNVWKDVLTDLLLMDIVFSIYITVITFIMGRLMTGTICNWSEQNSRAYHFNGDIIENPPSVVFIVITFFVIVFALIFVAGSITLYLWWITNWQWVGFIAAIVLVSIESVLKNGFLWKVYRLDRNVYMDGIYIGWQILYPVILCISLYSLMTLTVQRKDFLK